MRATGCAAAFPTRTIQICASGMRAQPVARIPEAQIWMVRVGHRSAHRIGGRERRET